MDFSEIIGNLKKAYKVLVVKKQPEYKWNGPMLTTRKILVGCPNIDEQLNKGNLSYNKKEQGRDKVDTLLTVAVQLGIQQGIEIAEEENDEFVKRLESDIKHIEYSLNSKCDTDKEKLKDIAKMVEFINSAIKIKKDYPII